ncbi:MAG: ACT domain-containing protein [Clostridia bacterium]|nr:ACT domain-containing protein [Clostridia bacterium]
MQLEIFPQYFSVCKLQPGATLPEGVCFFARTDNELSLVCETKNLPEATYACENEWRMFRVSGALDFSLIGILARITSILAEAGISVFCVSTYDTDYVLIKSEAFPKAISTLADNGYEIKHI